MFLENFYVVEVCICCVDHLQYGEKRSGKIKAVFIDCGYLLGLGRANSKEGFHLLFYVHLYLSFLIVPGITFNKQTNKEGKAQVGTH